MRQPYHNDPDTKGLLLFTDEELYDLAKLAYTNGYHLTAHCIGDAALEQMINTIQRVSTEFHRQLPQRHHPLPDHGRGTAGSVPEAESRCCR